MLIYVVQIGLHKGAHGKLTDFSEQVLPTLSTIQSTNLYCILTFGSHSSFAYPVSIDCCLSLG